MENHPLLAVRTHCTHDVDKSTEVTASRSARVVTPLRSISIRNTRNETVPFHKENKWTRLAWAACSRKNTTIKTSIEVQAAGPPHNEKENREIRDPDTYPSYKQTKMKRHSWRTQTTAVVMLSAPSVLHLVSLI